MPDLHVVVLAAGKGTRMKSQMPKVLHRVAGTPMLDYVLRAAAALEPRTTTVVVGHMAEKVGEFLGAWPEVNVALQEPQLGTGHALQQTEALLWDAKGTLLLLSGDVPLLTTGTIEKLLDAHRTANAALTVLTTDVDDPTGYGRIVRDAAGVARIVEESDATGDVRSINEINSGIYAFDLGPLFKGLDEIGSDNAQREYYLPDLVSIYRRQGLVVAGQKAERAVEVLGVNNQLELARMSEQVRHERCQRHMLAGVVIADPATTYIGPDVEIGADTTLHPGVTLEGKTRIGGSCEIHSGVRIVDCTLADRVTILDHCLVTRSGIASGAVVGPFVHIRPDCDIRENTKIGNFVELKKTVLGPESKASHLSYLGDATIGARVNVGAGTITCNYDGVKKHATVLEDDVFVGSDSQLIAPVTIGKGAYIAAGSSITGDVPAGALGIARSRQENKADWVARVRAARQAASPSGTKTGHE